MTVTGKVCSRVPRSKLYERQPYCCGIVRKYSGIKIRSIYIKEEINTMSVQVENLEKNMAKLTIEVSAEELEKALQCIFKAEE